MPITPGSFMAIGDTTGEVSAAGFAGDAGGPSPLDDVQPATTASINHDTAFIGPLCMEPMIKQHNP